MSDPEPTPSLPLDSPPELHPPELHPPELHPPELHPQAKSPPVPDEVNDRNRGGFLVLLLNAPDEARLKQHRYAFAQAVVFGLPVLALEAWGRTLGGSDAPRWVGFFQALLAGWVLYVAALAPLLSELALVLVFRVPRGWAARLDLAASAGAVAFFGAGLVAWVWGLVRGRPPLPLLFAGCVALTVAWNGWRWAYFARREGHSPPSAP